MKTNDSVRNIAIFASGTGTNAENIIRYFQENDCGIGVGLVVCNKPDASVIERAERLGVSVKVMPAAEIRDREKMLGVLADYDTELIVLAGFLLMVPDFIIERYAGRVINIHPSLLPKFGGKGMYGRYVHEAVVAAGETETGITIHHVTDKCDEGGIIFQAAVSLDPTDTPAMVESKVHALERTHFARVIREIMDGDL